MNSNNKSKVVKYKISLFLLYITSLSFLIAGSIANNMHRASPMDENRNKNEFSTIILRWSISLLVRYIHLLHSFQLSYHIVCRCFYLLFYYWKYEFLHRFHLPIKIQSIDLLFFFFVTSKTIGNWNKLLSINKMYICM